MIDNLAITLDFSDGTEKAVFIHNPFETENLVIYTMYWYNKNGLKTGTAVYVPKKGISRMTIVLEAVKILQRDEGTFFRLEE